MLASSHLEPIVLWRLSSYVQPSMQSFEGKNEALNELMAEAKPGMAIASPIVATEKCIVTVLIIRQYLTRNDWK